MPRPEYGNVIFWPNTYWLVLSLLEIKICILLYIWFFMWIIGAQF